MTLSALAGVSGNPGVVTCTGSGLFAGKPPSPLTPATGSSAKPGSVASLAFEGSDGNPVLPVPSESPSGGCGTMSDPSPAGRGQNRKPAPTAKAEPAADTPATTGLTTLATDKPPTATADVDPAPVDSGSSESAGSSGLYGPSVGLGVGGFQGVSKYELGGRGSVTGPGFVVGGGLGASEFGVEPEFDIPGGRDGVNIKPPNPRVAVDVDPVPVDSDPSESAGSSGT